MVHVLRTYDCKDQDARAEEEVMKDFDEMQNLIAKMIPGVDERRENADKLEMLVDTCREVAAEYSRIALERINDPGISPIERGSKAYQVLDHLREHVLLLSDVIRVPPRDVFSQNREVFLTKTLSFIARRLAGAKFGDNLEDGCVPDLLPMPAATFKYVHFRYMDCFGLIGVPAETAIEESGTRHLSVLPHEVGSHAVVIARESHLERLQACAEDLAKELDKEPGLWQLYREFFKEAVVENLPLPELDESELGKVKKQEILADLRKPHLTHFLGDEAIRRNQVWQVNWLFQLVPDIFSVMVFEDEPESAQAALQAMANALAMRYPPLVGDIEHPPLQLRLLVGIAYIAKGDPDGVARMASDFECGAPDVFLLDNPDNQQLAITIAEHCRHHIIDKDLLFSSNITPEDKDLARNILDPNGTPDSILDIVDAPESLPRLSPNKERLIGEINGAKTLDDLAKIKLHEVDLHQPFVGTGLFPS